MLIAWLQTHTAWSPGVCRVLISRPRIAWLCHRARRRPWTAAGPATLTAARSLLNKADRPGNQTRCTGTGSRQTADMPDWLRTTVWIVGEHLHLVVSGAVSSGVISGAGVDGFDVEPQPPHHPFRHLPRIVATPHVGYVSRGTYEVLFTEAVEDIAAFLAGTPVRVVEMG